MRLWAPQCRRPVWEKERGSYEEVERAVSGTGAVGAGRAFIWGFCVYFFNFFCNAKIFHFMNWYFPMKPFIISSSAYISKYTKCTNWISIGFIFFFDCLIDLLMS